jgi:hypothetical protein
MRAALRRAALPALALLPAACAMPAPPCPPGTQAATMAEAYFGQSRRDAPAITEAEWRDFLAATVTPAFPDGLTVLDGRGQWRRPDGSILSEPSKVLVLVLPGADAAAARARLRPVEEAWKARFRHQSVLTVYRGACVGF